MLNSPYSKLPGSLVNKKVSSGYIIGKAVFKILDYNKETLKLLKENNIDINNLVLQISIEIYEERMSKKTKDAMEDVEDRMIRNRILYHNIVKTVNEDLNNHLGTVYTIDANKTPSDVVIEALNHIHKILLLFSQLLR